MCLGLVEKQTNKMKPVTAPLFQKSPKFQNYPSTKWFVHTHREERGGGGGRGAGGGMLASLTVSPNLKNNNIYM